MKQFHIIESNKRYLVVEIFNYKEYRFSKVVNDTFKTIDAAEKYVIMLNEDAVPVMASSGIQSGGKPQVATFDPIMKFKIKGAAKRLLRRRLPK